MYVLLYTTIKKYLNLEIRHFKPFTFPISSKCQFTKAIKHTLYTALAHSALTTLKLDDDPPLLHTNRSLPNRLK